MAELTWKNISWSDTLYNIPNHKCQDGYDSKRYYGANKQAYLCCGIAKLQQWCDAMGMPIPETISENVPDGMEVTIYGEDRSTLLHQAMLSSGMFEGKTKSAARANLPKSWR